MFENTYLYLLLCAQYDEFIFYFVRLMNIDTACHSLLLPFTFDVQLLLSDMRICSALTWRKHFNNSDYSGDWTSIALYSASGDAEDIHTFGGTFQPTALLNQCSCFPEVISSFACDKESVRLLNLAAGSVIHEHRDRGLRYEEGTFRLHIPLQTNPDVDFIVGGQRMDMQAGECWYANFDLPHSVHNRSNENRVHLVIDCLRNEWSDALFGAAGYDFQREKEVLAPDQKTTLAMIAELERLNTDTSRAMIAELKKQINAGA
jgi:hypothetical protein